jgi:ribonuclease BN (tRNA processing enzyme)
MLITVLGGCGAWPAAGEACSGYLVDQGGFRLLVDPGYATLPRLLMRTAADEVDAVLVSHGHADHCADLHPLLRARAFRDDPAPALPVYALPNAVDAVLALDGSGSLRDACQVREFTAGSRFGIGPFQVETWLLPHWVPNAGLRLTAGGQVLSYTGDTGPSPDLIALARDADLFLAEATFAMQVPDRSAPYLSSARQAAENAAKAGVGRLLLTHLWPGTAPEKVADAAREAFLGPVEVARGGLRVDLTDEVELALKERS